MNFKIAALIALCSVLTACGKPGEQEQSTPSLSTNPAMNSNPQVNGNQTINEPAPQSGTFATAPATNKQVQPTATPNSGSNSANAPTSQPSGPISQSTAPSSAPESTPVVTNAPPPMEDDEDFDIATAELPESNSQPLPLEKTPLPKPRPLPRTQPPFADGPASAPATETKGLNSLERELLKLMNASRAKAGIAPLKFSRLQSNGNSKCMGSEGHSVHMGQTHNMSHDQFPQDICVRTSASGENVGMASGDQLRAIRTIHKMMMDEGPGGGHYQNIMSSQYNTVGLGFYYTNGALWVTENFLRL